MKTKYYSVRYRSPMLGTVALYGYYSTKELAIQAQNDFVQGVARSSMDQSDKRTILSSSFIDLE